MGYLQGFDDCESAEEAVRELREARGKFGPFKNEHEGYAVLLEEVDELWDEIKKNQAKRNRGAIRREAIQVAAMALRFVEDLCRVA